MIFWIGVILATYHHVAYNKTLFSLLYETSLYHYIICWNKEDKTLFEKLYKNNYFIYDYLDNIDVKIDYNKIIGILSGNSGYDHDPDPDDGDGPFNFEFRTKKIMEQQYGDANQLKQKSEMYYYLVYGLYFGFSIIYNKTIEQIQYYFRTVCVDNEKLQVDLSRLKAILNYPTFSIYKIFHIQKNNLGANISTFINDPHTEEDPRIYSSFINTLNKYLFGLCVDINISDEGTITIRKIKEKNDSNTGILTTDADDIKLQEYPYNDLLKFNKKKEEVESEEVESEEVEHQQQQQQQQEEEQKANEYIMHISEEIGYDIHILVQDNNTIQLKDNNNVKLKNKDFENCFIFSKSSKFLKKYIKLITGKDATPQNLEINVFTNDNNNSYIFHTCTNSYDLFLKSLKTVNLGYDIDSWDNINYNTRLDNLIKNFIILIYMEENSGFSAAGGRRILN